MWLIIRGALEAMSIRFIFVHFKKPLFYLNICTQETTKHHSQNFKPPFRGRESFCQFTHSCFLASQARSDSGRANWDWTLVWSCPPKSPAPQGSLRLGLWETKKKTKHTESASASSSVHWITMTLQRLGLFLLSFDISFIHREGYLCLCWKYVRGEDESTKRGRTSLQTSVKHTNIPVLS